MAFARIVFSSVVLWVLICSLPTSSGVPIQPLPSVQQTAGQLTPQDESMMYTAATYLLGRWLSAANTPAAPAVTTPVPTTPPAAPSTTLVPSQTASKQGKRTDLEESSGYSLLNLFMVVLRAVLGNNGQPQLTDSSQATPSTQKCACGGQGHAHSSTVSGDSLSQTAMKALLMVVSDVLSNQLSSNAAAAPAPSRGYFW